MIPFDPFDLFRRVEIDQVIGECDFQKPLDVLEIAGGGVLGIAPESVFSFGFKKELPEGSQKSDVNVAESAFVVAKQFEGLDCRITFLALV